MRIKITGNFTDPNNSPFLAYAPKESLTLSEAEAYLQNTDFTTNQSILDGYPLDPDSIQAELYDDEIIEHAEISRLKCVLYDLNMLDSINSYMNTKNGKTKIWWENVQTVDFYHPLVQEAISDLNLPMETAKEIWRQAKLID